MQVTTEKIDNHKVTMTMEVPQEEVGKAIEKAYHKLASKVNIPGFRKGKAPRRVLEARLGKEAVMDEVFEILATPAYSKALEEQNIEPVGRPEVEVINLKENEPFVFKATVVAKPEVVLGQYKGLAVTKPVVVVTEEEVEQSLESMRNRQAKMVVMENTELSNGDFAIIDFAGSVDGVPFEGGEGKGYPLEIGSGSFIPGFEEQLIGAKTGDERDVNVTFPTEYHAENLAGKEAVFKVKINDIKRKELPSLDDEFVKDVSDFSTLDELKADIRANLQKSADQKAEREFYNSVLQAALNNTTVDIPEIMVEERVNHMIEDLAANLESRGMKLDKYMEYAKMDMASLRSNYRDAAFNNVKTDLLLEAIVKEENIQMDPEDIEKELSLIAQSYQAPLEEVRKAMMQPDRLAALVTSITRKKASQMIMDNVVAKENEVQEPETKEAEVQEPAE